MSIKGFRVPPRSRAGILATASKLRRCFVPDNVLFFDVVRVLENVIPIAYPEFELIVMPNEDLPNELALTFPDKKQIIVREDVYKAAVLGDGRARFTMAHELGHIVLHSGIQNVYARSKEGSELRSYEDSEWQANVFSGEILAPAHAVKDMRVCEIMQECGVSYTVANIQLGLKNFKYRPWA